MGACCAAAAACGGCVDDAEEDASAIFFSSAALAWIWDGILRVRIVLKGGDTSSNLKEQYLEQLCAFVLLLPTPRNLPRGRSGKVLEGIITLSAHS